MPKSDRNQAKTLCITLQTIRSHHDRCTAIDRASLTCVCHDFFLCIGTISLGPPWSTKGERLHGLGPQVAPTRSCLPGPGPVARTRVHLHMHLARPWSSLRAGLVCKPKKSFYFFLLGFFLVGLLTTSIARLLSGMNSRYFSNNEAIEILVVKNIIILLEFV